MTTEAQLSAMRRKAGAGRPPREIGRFTAAKAVRLAVVQAADDVARLAVNAGPVTEARVTLEPFVEGLPDPALLALLEGPGGRYGLMVLDPQAVAALIEIQTTGRVSARPAEPRAPTRTDAIMCADFIDRLLELLDQRAAEAELDEAPAISGFRYALALSGGRAIPMTLEDIPYREFRFDVDLAHGAKTGAMQILLPFDPPGRARAGRAEADAFAEALRAHVMQAEVRLTATLHRQSLSLAEVTRLEVGSLLHLPRSALAEVAVEALDGTVVARGKLGQVNGHRAVRLTQPAQMAVPGRAANPANPGPAKGLAAPAPTAGARGLPRPGGAAGQGGGAPGAATPARSPTAPGDAGAGPDPADFGDLGDLGTLGDLGDPGL